MRVPCLLITLVVFLPAIAVGQESETCEGPYNNRALSIDEIGQVLELHGQWLLKNSEASDGHDSDPLRANLCGADLSGIRLVKADLSHANLRAANLSGAYLRGSSFAGASLERASLVDANLKNGNLAGARLIAADLSGATLTMTSLAGANLREAELAGANLRRADLGTANLRNANLAGARLIESDLSGSDLSGVNLSGVNLSGANLAKALYQPQAGKQPPVDSIAEARGLSELTYDQPRALVHLRKLFRDSGYRDQERRVTYVIRQVPNNLQLFSAQSGLLDKIEGSFNYILFDLTSKWGMQPSRALSTIAVLILVFWIPYFFVLRNPGQDGIWRLWSSDRVRADLGTDAPELLSLKTIPAIKLSLYFSLLSAFHIGWRDLNVGNWITRIQPREYTLRASGWVRTVSGFQSLLSVYLLAIWALTYFGRPFG